MSLVCQFGIVMELAASRFPVPRTSPTTWPSPQLESTEVILNDSAGRDGRLLVMLQRLLAIRAAELRPVLDEASTLIAETFDADKVDIFAYQPDTDSLVAL